MGDMPQSPATPDSDPVPRRRRADAARNRQALLDAARAALADGAGTFSLEGVARRAGVGIGTLYRHFPTREQLVTAAYDAEVDDLVAQAAMLLEQLPPRQALHEWLRRFVRFATTKRGVLDALRTEALEAAAQDHTGVRERMAQAVEPILRAGARNGSMRADIQAADLVLLMAGSLLPMQVDAARTERLLGLVLDALRPV